MSPPTTNGKPPPRHDACEGPRSPPAWRWGSCHLLMGTDRQLPSARRRQGKALLRRTARLVQHILLTSSTRFATWRPGHWRRDRRPSVRLLKTGKRRLGHQRPLLRGDRLPSPGCGCSTGICGGSPAGDFWTGTRPSRSRRPLPHLHRLLMLSWDWRRTDPGCRVAAAVMDAWACDVPLVHFSMVCGERCPRRRCQ